jgi:hypothetical protein
MPFETQTPPSEPSPDFEAGLKTYTEQVESISLELKAKQAELGGVQKSIEDAKTQRQLVYQTQRIEPLEEQIKMLQQRVSDLQEEHNQWAIKTSARKLEHDAIVLDFSQKQKALDDSWADFYKQAVKLLEDQKVLQANRNTLAAEEAQFLKDQAAWTAQSQQEKIALAQSKKEADVIHEEASELLAQATLQKKDVADGAAQLILDRQAFEDGVAAAQDLLTQADAVAKQKAQNEIDLKNNSAAALQNQNDAIQIKVARIALNNQEQEYNSRMQTLQAAEAALPKG